MKKILSNFRADAIAYERRIWRGVGERFGILAVKPHKRIYRPSYKALYIEEHRLHVLAETRVDKLLEESLRAAERELADMQENMAETKTPEQIALGIQETLRLDGGHRCISGEHHDTAGTLPTEPTVPPTRSSLGGICSVHGIFTGYRCSRCDQEADDDG